MKIDRALFKLYDIRGVFGENLTPRAAYSIGQAYGTFIQMKGVNRIMVGHDNRVSSQQIYHALIEGLFHTGCEVTELGLTLTPIMDFSWYELKAPATIMVTASHSPARYNGFKFSLQKNLIFGDDLQNMYKIITSGKIKKGQGKRLYQPINEAYVTYILKTVKLKRTLKIVLDCGNGTGSILAPQLFHELGCEVTLFHCISDGSFPNHDPYPQKIGGYKDHFIKELKTGKYDLGVALDGDCDRMGIFDETGNFIENDKIIYLHAREILKKHAGAIFVLNAAISQAVFEAIGKHGGRVVVWKTGPPYMLSRMKKEKALLGGEISGHVAFADRYFGFDDGIYTACRTLEFISQGQKRISQCLDDLPKYYSTPEFRVLAGEKKKFVAVINIQRKLAEEKNLEIIDVDGLRVRTKTGWFLIRASQTEPLVTGRAEATSQIELEKLKAFVQNLLREEGIELDWNNSIAKH